MILFEFRHVGRYDGSTVKLQSAQSSNIPTLIVFNKQCQTFDPLVFDKLEGNRCRVFFQLFRGQMQRLRWIDIIAVLWNGKRTYQCISERKKSSRRSLFRSTFFFHFFHTYQILDYHD